MACVVLFMVGSLACALAQTMTQLIVFRGLQGAGGGGLLTMVLIVSGLFGKGTSGGLGGGRRWAGKLSVGCCRERALNRA